MASDVSLYVPLKTVVSMAIDELEKSIGDFDKLWILAFRGMTKMGFAAVWEAKSVRLPVNQGNMTVNLPQDYLMWSKIGVMGDNGEVSFLKINKAISTWRDNNPNRLEAINPDVNNAFFTGLPGFPYFINYYSNGYYTPLFGLGNGLIHYSECTVDEKNKLIVLSPQYPFPDVMLEYVSAPQLDNDYAIPTCLQEALITFLKWKCNKATRQEFYADFAEGRRSLPNKRFSLQQIQDAIRSQSGFKLKN